MIPEYIIEKAIAGGWKDSQYEWAVSHAQDTVIIDMAKQLTCLDPDFWSALGKEMGWAEKMFPLEHFAAGMTQFLYWTGDNRHRYTPHQVGPVYHAHRLHDLILRKVSQTEIDAFWKSL